MRGILLAALLLLHGQVASWGQCDPENAFQQCFTAQDEGIATFDLKTGEVEGVYLNGKHQSPQKWRVITVERGIDTRDQRTVTGQEFHVMVGTIRNYILILPVKKGDVVEVRQPGFENFRKLLKGRPATKKK